MNIVMQLFYSKKVVLLLFSLLIATFPFGAHLFAFSIGFMTLYPFLLLLIVMTAMGVFHCVKGVPFHMVEKGYLLLLFLLLAIGIGFLPFVESVPDAKIDLRSALLMFLTAFVFFWTKWYVGFELWRTRLSFLLKVIYVLILFVALIELKTGIHIQGYFTEKIEDLNLSSFIYTPVFLYDNPNNLTVYVSLIGLSILLLEGFRQKNILLAILIIVCNFLISRLCSSRFGEIAVLFILLWLVFNLFIEQRRELRDKRKQFELSWILVVVSMALVTYTINPKYYSPIWTSDNTDFVGEDGLGENELDSLAFLTGDNENYKSFVLETVYVVDSLKPFIDNGYSSTKIRTALFLNGLEFIKDSKGMGVGPGQYRYKHSKQENKYYTKTNVGPHFWLLELATQYGFYFCILYLGGIVFLMFKLTLLLKKSLYLVSLVLISFPVYGILSMLPSSFLIFEINWVFSALFIALIPEVYKSKEVTNA